MVSNPQKVRHILESRRTGGDFSKIASNAGWLTADKVVRMGVGLLLTIWMARYLGPEKFGTLNFALAFVSLFSAGATLGLDGIAVRNLVKCPSAEGDILGTTFFLRGLGGIIAFLLSVMAIIFVRSDNPLLWTLVGVIAAGSILKGFDGIDFWFQSQVASKYVVFARAGAFLLSSGLKIALILISARLMAFAWAIFSEAALAGFGLAVAYMGVGKSLFRWKVSFTCARELLKDSWPLIFSALIIMIYMRIDQVMLGKMIDDTEVGIYSLAVRFSEVWCFVPAAVISSVFPGIVAAKTHDESSFHMKVQQLYNQIAFFGYMVAIPTTFLAGWAINAFMGPAYAGAGKMIAVLIWGIFFINLGMARSSYLTTMNWTRIHLFTVSLGGILNIILNFALIPKFGGIGAAIASLMSYWFAAHGVCFFYPPLQRTGWMMTKAIACPRVW